MTVVGNIALLVTYAGLAIAAGIGLAGSETPFGILSAPVISLAVLVACAAGHDFYARFALRRQQSLDAKEIRHRQARQELELDELRKELVLLRRDGAAQSQILQERRAAEMEMLRGLLDDLASRLGPPRRSYLSDQARSSAGPETRETKPSKVEMAQEVAASVIEIVREALEDNRVDLYLQPIVSLPQRKVRFYESFSRVRDRQGQILSPYQYLNAAEDGGLITAIDNLLLFRCVQLIRRLRRRQRNAGFFINLSRSTLEDRSFTEQFADFLQQNPDLTANLYFEIAQIDLDTLSPEAETAMASLARLGCRFSLDNVTSLAIDFAKLARRQFRFVKLDAGSLLSEVYQESAGVDVVDVKELLARYNIDLIAEKIETEQQVVNLLDYEVDFGQGFLFGEPRRSRDEV